MTTTTEETIAEVEAAAAAVDEVCACCGKAEVDDVKLKKCNGGCDLVKYCSEECQNDHRDQHEGACKKRMAEIRDRDLFEQPYEGYMGDCPICCLPLPLDRRKTTLNDCCSQLICNGCNYANKKRESEAGLEKRCAYCREPVPTTYEEVDKRAMKRIKKNCPVAMREMGRKCYIEGDYETALEYMTKAAKLGDIAAHNYLSLMYHEGRGVEKDNEKAIHHAELAAIAGYPVARHHLGCEEWDNGNFERARKHFIIAANLGYHNSLELIKELYANGHASKEEYADALRAYQAAVEATKSAERKKGEAYYEAMDAARQS